MLLFCNFGWSSRRKFLFFSLNFFADFQIFRFAFAVGNVRRSVGRDLVLRVRRCT